MYRWTLAIILVIMCPAGQNAFAQQALDSAKSGSTAFKKGISQRNKFAIQASIGTVDDLEKSFRYVLLPQYRPFLGSKSQSAQLSFAWRGKEVELAAIIGYQKTEASLTNLNKDYARQERLGLLLRSNYHFIKIGAIDPYIGLGLGYYLIDKQYRDISYMSYFVYTKRVYLEGRVGLKIHIGRYISAFGEAGIGQQAVILGIAYRVGFR